MLVLCSSVVAVVSVNSCAVEHSFCQAAGNGAYVDMVDNYLIASVSPLEVEQAAQKYRQ